MCIVPARALGSTAVSHVRRPRGNSRMGSSGLPPFAPEILTPSEIRELRRRCQLTQQELARKLNVSRETIVRWERGRQTPNPVYVELLHKVEKEILKLGETPAPASDSDVSPASQKTLHGKCPICGNGSLKPIPLHYSMVSTGATQTAGGIVAYRCVKKHIFFVMAKDIEEN